MASIEILKNLTPTPPFDAVEHLLRQISDVLRKTVCEESAKAIYYYRAHHFVKFRFPEVLYRPNIRFVKSDKLHIKRLFSRNYQRDTIVCYVPFTVEEIGINEFIARD